ncbi:hypothetical protein [Thermococcus sp. 21S9]|uniref:hypothetical protein n=1 Tax=Thermococcus sp. 21S9 TaxID=1638223 RepID=UPI00143C5CC4|nr:hypothetical protein [Thermococcus sp. 21S9]NJE54286.1 hypothetical protein [Thermococcus sp. 21S9]
MRRNARKRLLPLVFALVLTVVGAALAVPQITVKLQPLGQGQASYPSQYNITAAVNFQLSSNGSVVTGVKVYLDDTNNAFQVQAGDTVYVQLLDYNDQVIAYGSGTVQQDTTTGALYVSVTTFTYENGYSSIPIDQLSSVKVIYQGQEITS